MKVPNLLNCAENDACCAGKKNTTKPNYSDFVSRLNKLYN